MRKALEDFFCTQIKIPKPILLLILLGTIALCITNLFVAPPVDPKKFAYACQGMLEKGYFEGQKDAIYGDIRITQSCTTWVWKKSPWDGAAPGSKYCLDSVVFHPEINALVIKKNILRF